MSTTSHVTGTDTVVDLPLLGGVTYNEVHSALLGLVGVLVGAGYRMGHVKPAVGFTVFAVGIAFGLRHVDSENAIAKRVVQREPWYFVTVYVLTTLAGAGLPGLLG